ncbi:MAG: DNA polymerase III subunit delta [Flavobacteriaceae bacterium]|nr:MAG: DNA polymerase III subunit delta [Flavobacteriaceae bacterium]
MDKISEIISTIKKGAVKPIYFLMGDEPYYIDKISDYIEKTVLNETEKEFNQQIVYGREVTIEDIVSSAKRFPMMAPYQVVIVKEAQDLSRHIEKLTSYAENPQITTILVLNYKYKTLDKRKKLYKAITASGLIYESKKWYEYQIPDWVSRLLSEKNYQIAPKAAQMLVEFLGTDLSKISNELDKLMLTLPTGTTINSQHIEENIGISKDFNNFELRKAIGKKNIVKANRIINYFSENPGKNSIVMTISLLNTFFTQLLSFHGLKDKSKHSVAKSLGINPYFADEYVIAAKNYPMRKVAQVTTWLREADMKSKGVGAYHLSQGDILKELLFRIMH